MRISRSKIDKSKTLKESELHEVTKLILEGKEGGDNAILAQAQALLNDKKNRGKNKGKTNFGISGNPKNMDSF